MQYIDAFNHFFPKQLWDKMLSSDGIARDIGMRMRNIPCIYDLDERFRVMDRFENYTQILSLGMPPLDALGTPEQTPEFARLGNDGMAELCEKYPDRFSGYVACVAMNNMDESVKELERAFTKLHANGVQIHTNVGGVALDDERFFPIFELCAKHNKPVLLHPSRGADVSDYKSEPKSKYEIWWTFGWPYETSAAMARMVFSGMLDKLPDLKVLAHHMGAMVPFFEGRVGPGMDQLGNRTTDVDYKALLKTLKKRPFDYFKGFYADTATFGSKGAMLCGFEFYPEDQILFASDSPFDPEKGPGYIRDTIAVIDSLDLTQAVREKVCFRNAQKLFGLKS